MVCRIMFKIETNIPFTDYDRSVRCIMMYMVNPPHHRLIDGDQMVYEPFAGGFYLTMIRPYDLHTGEWLDRHTCEYIHLDRVEHVCLDPDKHFNVTNVSVEHVS